MIQQTPPASFDATDIRGGDADLDKVFPSGVRVGRTSYGLGLFAFAFIPKGTPIARVFGRVIHDPDYHSDYCIDVGDDRVLEPAAPFCYMNHCCEPNCILMHYVAEDELDGSEIEGNLEEIDDPDAELDGDFEDDEEECLYGGACDDCPGNDCSCYEECELDAENEEDDEEVEYPGEEIPHSAEVWVETLRDILPGQELTIDYAWPADRAAKCLCGAKTCRGWIVDPAELELLEVEATG